MWKSVIVLAACSKLTLGQNETLKFFWPNADNYTVPDVEIQSVNASVTVFHAACPTSSAGAGCNWRQGLDYTIFDQNTYEATMAGDDYVITRTCEDRGLQGVNCYAEGRNNKLSSSFLSNEVWMAEATNTVTASITSGGEKLEAAAATHNTGNTGSAVTSGSVSATDPTASSPAATSAAQKHSVSRTAGFMALFLGAAEVYT